MCLARCKFGKRSMVKVSQVCQGCAERRPWLWYAQRLIVRGMGESEKAHFKLPDKVAHGVVDKIVVFLAISMDLLHVKG
jgi:hypothetical protein